MWVRHLILKNIRSFENVTIPFSRGINIIVGPNNVGKSTILLPLLSLQDGLERLSPTDKRLGQNEANAEIIFEDIDSHLIPTKFDKYLIEFTPHRDEFFFVGRNKNSNRSDNINRFQSREPRNFIIPIVSKRKVIKFSENVSQGAVHNILPNFENLVAKIDHLSNFELPTHQLYLRACDEILGFRVTTTATDNGKKAVFIVNETQNIPLDAMGDGVISILGIVVHLAMSDNKLFIIEEPENDIHPLALKGLLNLIQEKSNNNQFIITTHSNIVLKKLGCSKDAKIYRVFNNPKNRIPTSEIREVDPSPLSRREILDELGYELNDLDLWDAWLILEEASAEYFIRKFLISWFTPKLAGRLRTYSARCKDEITRKFEAFLDLLVFLNLQPMYKNRAWVILDEGNKEKEIILNLKSKFPEWNQDRFLQLTKHDFEKYYPESFQAEVDEIFSIPDKEDKRRRKDNLRRKVEEWISSVPEETAKEAFKKSASEVIEILKKIDSEVIGKQKAPATDSIAGA